MREREFKSRTFLQLSLFSNVHLMRCSKLRFLLGYIISLNRSSGQNYVINSSAVCERLSLCVSGERMTGEEKFAQSSSGFVFCNGQFDFCVPWMEFLRTWPRPALINIDAAHKSHREERKSHAIRQIFTFAALPPH